ncbi:MAG: pimeloyl-ACP methyl ester carboxylesterase [Gammaproteobacteria bacterium]|jgi:pimeloyl-ACP methyl ester carboxylesterase
MNLAINGRSAYISTLGRDIEPTKPSIVFIHGAAMDHTVWTLFARYFLRHGYNSLAVDLPGHGRSEGPALTKVEDLSQWVDGVIAAAKLEHAIVVGHSLGSLVAFDLAATTNRVTALGLVGVAMPMPVADVLLNAAKENHHDGLDMVNVWGHSPRAHIGGFAAPGMWMSGAQLRLLERAGPGVLFADLSACNAYTGGLDKAEGLRCPVRFVLGDRDMMTPPRATRTLREKLPNAQVSLLKDCGHALMSERPNEVLDALVILATEQRQAA